MRLARLRLVAMSLAVAGLTPACIVLPIPQRVVHYPTLVGRLMVRATGQPAPDVLVSIGEAGACPCTRTNAAGEFELVADGTRFPWTSGLSCSESMGRIAIIWATLEEAGEPRRRRIGQILFHPPTWNDPGSANDVPAELGTIWL